MTTDRATDPHASWGNRTPVFDDGELVFVFSLAESTRSGRPWADGVWRPPTAPVAVTADLVEATLAGHAVSTSDAELAGELIRRGGSELRHAHSMSHDLVELPVGGRDARLVVSQLTADELHAAADRLGAISQAAYPPGHPDHEFDDVAQTVHELRGIASGAILGPFLDVSTIARVGDDPVGACLIVDRPGVAPDGGPWIVEVFRSPNAAVKQIGSSLIAASLAATKQAGLPSVSLAVSHGNANAFALYTALGFIDADENWTIAVD